MARTKISEFSATPNDNTDIDGIDIAEGCAPSGINNAIRELMSQLKDMQTGASGDTFTLTTVNSTTIDTTNLEVTNLKAKDGTAAGSIANTTGVVTLGSSVLTTTDINGGTIDGTTIGASTPSTVVATQVDIAGQGDLRLQDTTGGEYVALQAPSALAASYTLTLPVDDGTSGQALITDGAGVLSWSSAASGDVYGPGSATDNAVARYDGTTGKIIQNSAVTIGDDGATVIAANSSSDGLRITQTGAGNALLVEDSANPDATPVVIDAGGKVVVGYTAARSNASGGGINPQLQVEGESNNATISSIQNFTANTSRIGGQLILGRSLGATNGSNTLVTSGEWVGTIGFQANDGTNFISAASIAAAVDGTSGTNDMPGRLVFSTTADGASSTTERMRIDSAGNVGIGVTAGAESKVVIAGTLPSSGSNTFTFTARGTIPSTTTSQAQVIRTAPSTQATTFTLSSLNHVIATQGTIGAGSSVTNQYGFHADSSLTGATNNYGFYGNIASGTGRWNFYAAGTADNYFAGNVGIGTATPGYKLDVQAGNPTNGQIALFRNSTANGNGVTIGFDLNNVGSAAVGIPNNTNALAFYVNTSTTERMRIASTGTISLGAAPGAESLRVTPVASAVNYVTVYGNTTSGAPGVYAEGSDTNIGLTLAAKNSANISLITNGVTQFRVAPTASAVNYLQVTGSATTGGPVLSAQGSDANIAIAYAAKGTGAHVFTGQSGANQFIIASSASAVNYLQVTGAATAGAPYILSTGSDANVDFITSTKGTGSHLFQTSTTALNQFSVGHTASAVNFLRVTGSATGNALTLSALGSDTNIDIALTPKGTGNVRFGTHTASSDVAISGYITIKDSAGNTRKLAVIS